MLCCFLKQSKNTPPHEDGRKTLKQKAPPSVSVRTNRYHMWCGTLFVGETCVAVSHSFGSAHTCVCRGIRGVENLLNLMSSIVRRHKKNLQLRNICSEESVWRSHLNHCMARAHLALLYRGLDQLHGGRLQHRFKHTKYTVCSFPFILQIVFERQCVSCHFCSGTASVIPWTFLWPTLVSCWGGIHNSCTLLKLMVCQRGLPLTVVSRVIWWLQTKRGRRGRVS